MHFKLSPTYVLYMACRYVLSPAYRPDMSPSERTHKVIAIVNKMVSMMEGVIQVSTFFLLVARPVRWSPRFSVVVLRAASWRLDVCPSVHTSPL